MLDVVWLNIIELSKHEPFTQLLDKETKMHIGEEIGKDDVTFSKKPPAP